MEICAVSSVRRVNAAGPKRAIIVANLTQIARRATSAKATSSFCASMGSGNRSWRFHRLPSLLTTSKVAAATNRSTGVGASDTASLHDARRTMRPYPEGRL